MPRLHLLIVELNHNHTGLGERLKRVPDVTLVGTVHSAGEALRMIREVDPTVILVNMGSWDLDAEAFCKEFCGASSVPVAVLASFMAPDKWEGLKRAGASELVLRGTPTAEVVATLRSLAG